MSDKEKLVDVLLEVFPLMHRSLMKGLSNIGIPKQQLWLLFHINKEDGKLMSHYSEKMMIPKSNITLIADKLIEEGLIERAFDNNDRRIIILKITEKGKNYLVEHKEIVRNEMIKKLESFSDNDVNKLNNLMEEVKTIFKKIEE